MALGIGLSFFAVVPSPLLGQSEGIEVRPGLATITAGDQMQFLAIVRDAEGREHGGDRPIGWSTAPSDAASVDAQGVFYAHRPGLVRVMARLGEMIGVAEVVIEPQPAATVEIELDQHQIVVGGSTILRAIALNPDGEPLRTALFTFQSGDERVAVVTPSGVVTGRREGAAILAATSGAARTEVRIRVIRNRVAVLSVSGPTHARSGDVVRLRVIAEDERRLPVAEPAVRWSVSGRGARVDGDGGFVADRPGTFLITVSVGSVAGTHPIRVDPRPRPDTLTLVGHLALGSVEVSGMAVGDDVVYLATRANRIYTIDIGNPGQPRLIDSLSVDARAIAGITLADSGRLGVVARRGGPSGRGGLVFLDLADSRHPKLLSDLPESVIGDVSTAFADGRHLYAAEAGTGWLRVIDIGDPRVPRLVGNWRIPERSADRPDDKRPPGMSGRHLHDVHVLNGLAYLAYGRHGLVILDVGNGLRGGRPDDPQLVSRFAYDIAADYPSGLRAGTRAVFPSGSRVFVADGVFPPGDNTTHQPGGLGRVRVVDTSDPERPKEVAEYYVPERRARALWVEQDVLYVGLDGGGLRTVDASGSLRGDLLAQGREIGVLWTGSPEGIRPNVPSVVSIRHYGNLIVVADANTGLWLARLTNIEGPG